MYAFDPVHILAVLIHSLVQWSVAHDAANTCILKFRALTCTVTEVIEFIRYRQHRYVLVDSFEYILNNRALCFVDDQSAVFNLVAIRTPTARVPAALRLDTSALARSYRNIFAFLLSNELKERAVNICEFASLDKFFSRAEKSNVFLFERVKVVKVKFCITRKAVVLKNNYSFKRRIGHIVAVENLVQRRTVVFGTAYFIDLPVDDIVSVCIGI